MQPINTNNISGIFPKGNAISNANFIGDVSLHMMVENAQLYNCIIAHVTFEPGARNSWHSHPGGQILLITSGHGLYQQKGKPAVKLQAGDMVAIEPDVIHWHGAAPDSSFSHIAIGTNAASGDAHWMSPVEDNEYHSAAANAHEQTDATI